MMRGWMLPGLSVLVLVGCGGGSDPAPPSTEKLGSTTPADSGSTGTTSTPDAGGSPASDAAGDSALLTACGSPGDKGNSLGVGKYCNGFSDCAGNSQAILCATLGDPNAHFCTFACTSGDMTACGSGASCQCQNGQCGCVLDTCKR